MNLRACVKCGKFHGMIVQDSRTGQKVSEIDKCYECFWESAYDFNPNQKKIHLEHNEFDSEDLASLDFGSFMEKIHENIFKQQISEECQVASEKQDDSQQNPLSCAPESS